MLLDQFPDISWLKTQIKSGFSGLPGHLRNGNNGWPSVVLSAKAMGVERIDIKGPFSLFLNLSGESTIEADRKSLRIGTDSFGITNLDQNYSLTTPSAVITKTFNIHFEKRLFIETLTSLKGEHEQQLDAPFTVNATHHTFVKTMFRDKAFNQSIAQLASFYKNNMSSNGKETEDYYLQQVLIQVMRDTQKTNKGLLSISSLKRSTREELIRRLLIAKDYIHEHYARPISLDELSLQCALSKYHFLRTFKEAFGITPNQYIKKIRLEKARQLLETTHLTIRTISEQLGFEEPNSFSKFFLLSQKKSPGDYRKLATLDSSMPNNLS